METHTQIIEFFGLPACGKSTLCDALLREEDRKITFCRMTAISSEYRKISPMQKIRIFPYRASFELSKLIIKSGVSMKNLPIYKGFFLILIIYAYCKHTKHFDYMLVDHGVMQTIVSLFYESDNDKFESSLDVVSHLLNIICIDVPIYCDIPINEAMHRMRKRNRTDSGRLDAITDDNKLEQAMYGQARQFQKLSYLVDGHRVDMSLCVEQCNSTVLNMLSK